MKALVVVESLIETNMWDPLMCELDYLVQPFKQSTVIVQETAH
jgi:hypothetical protein